ncbi:GGDEF domain-containing protein [Demequina subtropica]|uniref:GGDEF domain-containing protein n=1 Tax=Demequina subtropica TaxID=1638989 RepID=UPI0012E0A888|nr:GGDEF domain-containing protein [Demequina subtropica]
MDEMTLNVALTLVSLTVLVLSIFAVYLRDRSRYAAWWIGLLISAALSNAMSLVITDQNALITVPPANAAGVYSAACAWAASRALRGARTGWRLTLPGVAAASVASAIEAHELGYWAGSTVTLLCMTVYFVLSARDLWMLRDSHARAEGDVSASAGTMAITGLAVGASALATFYVWRTVLFVALGPEDPFFAAYAGVSANALAVLFLLIIITFTLSELSQVERVVDLQMRATLDTLTGLWNRDEFTRRAAVRLRGHAGGATVVVADVDRFKQLNDTCGHAAGDRALAAFGATLRDGIGARDLAGRIGGEEFGIVFATGDTQSVLTHLSEIRGAYARATAADVETMPTVSYGVAVVEPGERLDSAIHRADAAMYRAKREGRDRIVVAERPRTDGASSQAA